MNIVTGFSMAMRGMLIRALWALSVAGVDGDANES